MQLSHGTLIGICAILLWSTLIGLMRIVSDGLGPLLGPASIYAVAFVITLICTGFPRLSSFPRSYLILGSILFVAYEILLSLSISFAENSRQAIEVAILNYLWPALVVIFSTFLNHQKIRIWIVIGICCSMYGICTVLGGEYDFNLDEILKNLSSNPLSYIFATVAAFLWAIYCSVTAKISKGQTSITFFLLLIALVLWSYGLTFNTYAVNFDLKTALALLCAGAAIGLGYAAWNKGMACGNVRVLAVLSYFIPILSTLVSSLMLNTPLSFTFWKGVLFVCLGSVFCLKSLKKS